MKKIYGYLQKSASYLAVVSYGGTVAVMLLMVIDVILRKTVNSSVRGAYELTEILLAMMVFAALAYTQTHKGHIRVNLVIKALPRTLGMILFAVNECLSTVMLAFCSYAAIQQTEYAIRRKMQVTNILIPIAPFYAFEAICMVMFTVVMAGDAIFALIAIFKKEYADDILNSI